MPEALMSIGELAQELGEVKSIKGASGVKFSSVEIDSRKVKAGSLFFAIQGERDGHAYVQDAFDNGASAAVVSYIVPVSIPQLVVDDTRKALLHSAAIWRRKFGGQLAAIAGSNGKTTTTQMLLSIFDVACEPDRWVGTQGNLNNDMGVALTLWRLGRDTETAALEVGMNHVGEMRPIVEAMSPTVGAVTNTMRDHQEFLVSLEETARDNGEVFRQLPENGIAVINDADPFQGMWRELASGKTVVSFGADESDVHADHIFGTSFVLTVPQGGVSVTLGIPGRHNIKNAVCAAAVATALGIGPEEIKKGLEKFKATAHRGEVSVLEGGSVLIDDSYNANPDSMLAAIGMLKEFELPKVCALGDMAELGAQSVACHAEIGRAAKDAGIDHFMCVGNRMMDAADAYGKEAEHFETKEELTAALIERLKEKPCAVLVKASNSSGLHKIINNIKEQVGVSKD